MRPVVALGELLWDEFPDGARRPGGAPANFAYHMTQLGRTTALLSRVGQDADAAALISFLLEHGLSIDWLQRDGSYPTGRVTVHTPSSGPAYTIHRPAAWDFFQATAEWRAVCKTAAAICFGSLAQRHPQSRATIAACLAAAPADCLRVLDVNLRPPDVDLEHLRQQCATVSVLKLNAEETQTLMSRDGSPRGSGHRSLPELARALGALAPPLIVQTCGAEGCRAWRTATAELLHVPASPIAVVDTVGAGDAFTAGLVYGLLQPTWSLERTLALANTVGGLVATRAGAMPEYLLDPAT